MKFHEFREMCAKEPLNGRTVWICDYRFRDPLEKPIRHVLPIEVEVVSVKELPKGKKVYYSDVFFRPVGTRKVIGPYDNTGFRSYAGESVEVFFTETGCRQKYMELCAGAIKAIDERIKWVVDNLTEKRDSVLAEIADHKDRCRALLAVVERPSVNL